MIQADMISANEFQEMAYEAEVSSVPHTVITPGNAAVIGAVPEDMLAERIKSSLIKKE